MSKVLLPDSKSTRQLSMDSFYPAGVITGIGSVPFSDPELAVDFVEEVSSEIPFWPKPVRGFPCSAMVEQLVYPFKSILENLDGAISGYQVQSGKLEELLNWLNVAPVELIPETTAGFFAFENALEAGRFSSALALKGQTTGPITLAMNLFHDGQPFLAVSEYREAIGNYLARLVVWQIERLRKWGKPVILFLNEPYLAAIKEEYVEPAVQLMDSVLLAVKSAGAISGVHSCAAPPVFSVLGNSKPDLISMDASQDLENFLQDEAAQDYIRSGGGVAFGIAPRETNGNGSNVMPLYMRWVMSIPREISPRELAKKSIVAVTCGLATVNEENARKSFDLARKFGDRIRKLAERELLVD